MDYISIVAFAIIGSILGVTLGILGWIAIRKSQDHDSTEHAFGDW